MGYLDVFLSLIIAWGAYNGFSKGLVNELASVLGIISVSYTHLTLPTNREV